MPMVQKRAKKPPETHPWRRGLPPREVVNPVPPVVVNSGLVDPDFDLYSLEDIQYWVEKQEQGRE